MGASWESSGLIGMGTGHFSLRETGIGTAPPSSMWRSTIARPTNAKKPLLSAALINHYLPGFSNYASMSFKIPVYLKYENTIPMRVISNGFGHCS
jgi:hypothetical protein